MPIQSRDDVATRLERIAEQQADERGATAVEYALMTALIALAIFASVALFGQGVNDLFERLPPEMLRGGS